MSEFQMYLPLRAPGMPDAGYHLFEAQEKQERYALARLEHMNYIQDRADALYGKDHSSRTRD